MKRPNLFEDHIKKEIVKRVKVNRERAKSLLLESERKMFSLKNRLEKLGINNENANDYVEYCYDIVMHLVRAKMYLNGYHASGQGAHEAEVSYLRILGFDEGDVQFTDQMRFFRNGIMYYGTRLDEEYAKKVVEFTRKIYPKLKEMIK
ncbi:MAG: hypothetical protein AABW45_01545 [Nanoarchaeota archaeon]